MSGIAGFLDPSCKWNAVELQALASDMADAIRQHDPDNNGTWADEESGLSLGLRRLAALDLSPASRLPALSADGRYVLVFDGEIYNHKELSDQLRTLGHSLRGSSDTEAFLAGLEQWGLYPAVEHLNGMFAFALWDRRQRRLFVGRDRMGVKPLYYGWFGGIFLFASELKALQRHPAFSPSVNPDALALLLRYGYIPAPHSIYQGLCKLIPGTVLEVSPEGATSQPQAFWSARQVAVQGVYRPFSGSEAEAVEQLDALLRDSIRHRFNPGVPSGAFLSGGIDSSTIVALMQAQGNHPVKTFAIGFTEPGYNEADHARAVARHLQTEHTELIVSPKEALEVIPLLPEIYDEPFADSSQIPTFLAARLARQQIVISLSGDGGDELFAGYNRYPGCSRLWRSVGWVPQPLRLLAKGVLDALAAAGFQRAALPAAFQKALRDRRVLSAATPQALYHRFISLWEHPTAALLQGAEPLTSLTDPGCWLPELDFEHWMMYLDLITSLPDDTLVKVGCASKAAGLEVRAPLLDDHRLIEFAWRIPLAMKIRDGRGKWLLRQVLYRHVPPELVERPKQGFMVPLADWLRGPLRPWVESQLDKKRLEREGFFNSALISEQWRQHLEGKRSSPMELWSVLMFQAWLEHTARR